MSIPSMPVGNYRETGYRQTSREHRSSSRPSPPISRLLAPWTPWRNRPEPQSRQPQSQDRDSVSIIDNQRRERHECAGIPAERGPRLAMGELYKTAGGTAGQAREPGQVVEWTRGKRQAQMEPNQQTNQRRQRNRDPDQLMIKFALSQRTGDKSQTVDLKSHTRKFEISSLRVPDIPGQSMATLRKPKSYCSKNRRH